MKNIKTFEDFLNEALNESKLYGVDPGMESEIIYNSLEKKATPDKKMKIKWKSDAGFEKVACFTVTDVISNDLIVFNKFPGPTMDDRDAKTNIFKRGFGIVSLPMHWSGGKFNPQGLPEDIVKLVDVLGLRP